MPIAESFAAVVDGLGGGDGVDRRGDTIDALHRLVLGRLDVARRIFFHSDDLRMLLQHRMATMVEAVRQNQALEFGGLMVSEDVKLSIELEVVAAQPAAV